MIFEWDEEKRRKNKRKHGVDFSLAEDFEWNSAIYVLDDSEDYGEERITALGFIKNRLHTCVYTKRDKNRRIISLRKATKTEETYYAEEITSFN